MKIFTAVVTLFLCATPSLGEDNSLPCLTSDTLMRLADEYANLGDRENLDLALEELSLRRDELDLGCPREAKLGNVLDRHDSRVRSQSKRSRLDNPDRHEFFGTSLPQGSVVLTLDDGPHETLTGNALDLLMAEGAPATFFQLGHSIKELPELTRSIAREGYSLGNHSYNHPKLTNLDSEKIRTQISSTQKILTDTLGGASEFNDNFQKFFANLLNLRHEVVAPMFFRSPYGARNDRVMGVINSFEVGKHWINSQETSTKLSHIMWNVDSLDWKDKDPRSIENRVFSQLKTQGQRGILLFHDIHPQTIEALKTIIPRLRKEGYKIVPLFDVLKISGL